MSNAYEAKREKKSQITVSIMHVHLLVSYSYIFK